MAGKLDQLRALREAQQERKPPAPPAAGKKKKRNRNDYMRAYMVTWRARQREKRKKENPQ